MHCRLTAIVLGALLAVSTCQKQLRKLGSFTEYWHDVAGDVYALDEGTIFIQNFVYDGQGPDAFFYATNAGEEDFAQRIPLNEVPGGKEKILRQYRGENVTVTLPASLNAHDLSWFSVWCRALAVNFGDVIISNV